MNNYDLSLKEHIQLVHDSDDGYISLLQNDNGLFTQRHFKINSLDDIDINNNIDNYMSINSFYIPKRKIENVRRINGLYLDIDNHNNDITRYSIEGALYTLYKEYFNIIIPEPTLILFTGRGFQLFFKIDDLPKQGLALWQMVQNEIINKMKDFNYCNFSVDESCNDVTRVFRLVDTLNTKSKTKSYCIELNNNTYRLNELIEEYFPNLKAINKPKSSNKKRTSTEKNIFNLYTIHSLHYARLQDIVKLQELRNYEGRACREKMCFLYRYYSILFNHDKEKALQDTLDFNNNFIKPLKERNVKSQTRSAEKAFDEWLKGENKGIYKRGGYNYSNKTLIKFLRITEEEQKELITIIGKDEKYRRRNIKDKQKRRDDLGLTKKQRELYELKEKIIELKNKNYNNTQIAKILNINRTKVIRLLK